jgi:hypothetical protein
MQWAFCNHLGGVGTRDSNLTAAKEDRSTDGDTVY